MKTTIDLAPALLRAAKELAAREGTTLRALVETGLRRVLEEQSGSRTFELRDASYDGAGLQPEFRDAGWEAVRRAAYDERGG
ncbi:MAG: hypothetical protein MSC30_09305 [Gaiellaceae bacterium MAG52_C11]|nr:hypothetical protein [Candidatus Gaiellasilicea maunaloa]